MGYSFLKYVGTGILLAYALKGGCDSNIEDVLREKYSRPIIAARKSLSGIAFEKSSEFCESIDSRLKEGDKK